MLVMLEGTAHQLLISISLSCWNLSSGVNQTPAITTEGMAKTAGCPTGLDSTCRDFPPTYRIMNASSRQFQRQSGAQKADSITNRLVLGILTAALFVGSASLWSNQVPPKLGDVSIPGSMGCAIAVYLGFTLVRAIRKSGRLHGRD